MNIHHLIQALEHLREARIATINAQQRADIEAMIEKIDAILRSYGVFIGAGE